MGDSASRYLPNIRKSTFFIGLTFLNLLLFSALLFHGGRQVGSSAPEVRTMAKMVRELGLTDLCLFTEARYTRHPAMADYHAPFQEHPAAFEHFPSGSLLLPTRQVTRSHAQSH